MQGVQHCAPSFQPPQVHVHIIIHTHTYTSTHPGCAALRALFPDFSPAAAAAAAAAAATAAAQTGSAC